MHIGQLNKFIKNENYYTIHTYKRSLTVKHAIICKYIWKTIEVT